MRKTCWITSLILCSAMLPFSAHGQSYATIDDSLNLYCADLPDGTNALTRVINNRGLYTVTPVDAKEETKKILKIRKQIQQRVNALSKLRRDYDPSTDLKKLKKIFNFVANEVVDETSSDEKFDNTKPNRIFHKIGYMISQLKLRLDALQDALEKIDRCLKNEDLIPPPQVISTEIVIFPFTHPDYKDIQWMRGLGVTALLHKKRGYGEVCVAASKSNSDINTFPKESRLSVYKNPCLLFWQRTFRNFPICQYGSNEHVGVGWIDFFDTRFSPRQVDESDLRNLEQKLAHYGKIYVRAPTKKNPCRTGK